MIQKRKNKDLSDKRGINFRDLGGGRGMKTILKPCHTCLGVKMGELEELEEPEEVEHEEILLEGNWRKYICLECGQVTFSRFGDKNDV